MNLCGFEVGLDRPFFLIAGPCVIESEQLQLDVAGQLKEITGELGIPFIFKSSFDKANRTSMSSFRGPGMEEGLRVLAEVKRQLGVPVLTDVHEYTPLDEVTSVVDVLQIPAFLFAILYVGYSIWMDRRGRDNVNHSAHLWGAAYGLLFTVLLEPRILGHFTQTLFGSGTP